MLVLSWFGQKHIRLKPLVFVFKRGVSMADGTVKWFDKKKGYGFISDSSDNDVFVHYTGFFDANIRTLHEGDKVAFETIEGEKGPRAEKVVLKPRG